MEIFGSWALIGPVIGDVTDTTARILFEFSYNVTITLSLVSEASSEGSGISDGQKFSFTKRFTPEIPAVVVCHGLSPATRYAVSISSDLDIDFTDVTGSFRTLPSHMSYVRIAAAACDNMRNRGPINMWSKLYDTHIAAGAPDPIDFLIHHGDQVYADSAFKEGMKLLKAAKWRANPEVMRKITREYQLIYRRTWSSPVTRRVLASVPNLMLWDDHEVRNDWGRYAKDRDPSSPSYIVGLCARQAYWWYQRQLWSDLPTASPSDESLDVPSLKDEWITVVPADWSEFCFKVFPGGECAAMFVDMRGSRSFYYSEDSPYFGSSQWAKIQETLATTPTTVHSLLVVHTNLVVFLPPSVAKACPCLSRDKMGLSLYPSHQKDYLDMLWQWPQLAPGRSLALLSGDMHFAMKSDVLRDGVKGFSQFTTSALSNKPPCCWGYYAYRCCMMCCNDISGYTVKHGSFHPGHNYGRINIGSPSCVPPSEVTFSVVPAKPVLCNTRGCLYC